MRNFFAERKLKAQGLDTSPAAIAAVAKLSLTDQVKTTPSWWLISALQVTCFALCYMTAFRIIDAPAPLHNALAFMGLGGQWTTRAFCAIVAGKCVFHVSLYISFSRLIEDFTKCLLL